MRWLLCRAVLFLLVKKGALMNFAKRAEETESAIIKDRHFLHEHAELSFEEKETTAYLVSELEKMGIPVQTFPDYTGCIATIKGEKGDGPTILLRADIDALPIMEESGVDFASRTPGVMHACGHDCHASILLAEAITMWITDIWKGSTRRWECMCGRQALPDRSLSKMES